MKAYEHDAAKLEVLEAIWQRILDRAETGELGGYACSFCGYGPAGRFSSHEDNCLMPQLVKVMRESDGGSQIRAAGYREE
jgi:hypothetical protein